MIRLLCDLLSPTDQIRESLDPLLVTWRASVLVLDGQRDLFHPIAVLDGRIDVDALGPDRRGVGFDLDRRQVSVLAHRRTCSIRYSADQTITAHPARHPGMMRKSQISNRCRAAFWR